MPGLQKATLTEIKPDGLGPEVPVQFNPASLRLQLANRLESQETSAQQTRQYLGKTSTTLSFDLHFDTADEGTTEAPVSVRERTAAVERFVLPTGEGAAKQKPPKVRFHWKDLQIDGVIEDVTIDFTLFASDGTALRAKIGVVIKEQDARYQLGETGPGANRAAGVQPPGRGGAGPGSFGLSAGLSASASIGVGAGISFGASASLGLGGGASVGAAGAARATDRSQVALDGESAAAFAARVGVDPAAWRGIARGADPLALPAGAAIDFPTSLTPSAGVGVSIGPDVGATASAEARVGLDPRNTPPSQSGVALGGLASAGFALSAAGGVRAAIATVQTSRAAAASTSTRAAFGSAAPTRAAASPAGAAVPHGAALGASSSQAGVPNATSSAGAPPDPRASSFGLGVPLRPSVRGAAVERRAALGDRVALGPRDATAVQPTADPTASPWTRLPADRTRGAADRAQAARRPARPCGCRGRCGHDAAAGAGGAR